MTIQFKVRCRLINGKYLSLKSVDKITVTHAVLELCTTTSGFGIDPKTYYESWKLKKEDKGWIWREVTHDGGINGFHKTIRKAVMSVCNSRYKVTCEV